MIAIMITKKGGGNKKHSQDVTVLLQGYSVNEEGSSCTSMRYCVQLEYS